MKSYLTALAAFLMAGLLFALVGYLIELATGQNGWALTLGALGASAGAYWAGARRAEGKPIWPTRSRPGVAP
jgi:hypothetical protein